MMRKLFLHGGFWALASLLGGCPLLNDFLEAPESAFEGTPTSGEAPLTVLFVDASDAGTTNITEWQWDFGDGATSTSRSPSHIYQAPGVYTVSLTVTTSVGTHTEMKRDYIRVVEKPEARFTAAPVTGGAPLMVSFADTSEPGSSPITTWEWNFGDRTPLGTEQNPNHVYNAPGLYTVSLTVMTEAGTDKETKAQLINVAGAPVADFSSDSRPGVAPLAVKFTDKSAVGTATILSRAWDFGDGMMSAEQNPSHTYTTPGNYTVSLALETTAGNDSVAKENHVVVDLGPTASFVAAPLMGSAPLTVDFADTSVSGTRAITSRLWDFGDGGLLSTLQNPTRTYTAPGTYSVSLRVTTSAGSNTFLQPDYITVSPGVSFTASPVNGKGSLRVQFADQTDAGAFSVSARAWDFGDGGKSAEADPEHTYAAPGVYDVTLKITTELGESAATRAGLITVSPDTAFSAAPAKGAPPLNVAFTDETRVGSFEVSAWKWNFGDGATSTEPSPTHEYTVPGIYNVSLQTTTDNGADVEEQTGAIQVQPVVHFSASAQTGQGSLAVSFQDMTNAGNLNILSWFWNFGDGNTSSQRNPSHTYTAMGTYDVTLTVTTTLGDQPLTRAGFIKVGPKVDFKADALSGVGALTVSFTDLTDAGALAVESRMWDFGDGMTSEEQNPKHDYVPGLYTVRLTVTTSQGETVTAKEDLILVTPLLTIGVVQPTGPAPFEASLLDLTMPGKFEVTGWRWDLGDGTTSEEQNPVHTYEAPGKYSVTLTLITDGGDFSKAMPDFITAQRGPTAAFSQTVVRGGAPEDPVTVSFINMSLPGDSPILNQSWMFGASAISDEALAMEANPVVIYPGPAFDTVPQDVSLTVRTFIAENTLLKENLFNAPVVKSALPPDLLREATLTTISTDASGDVWVAGSAGGALVARLSPAGTQRWGLLLENEEGLKLNAVHAPGDGTLYAAATLGGAAWLARFDAAGSLLWECRHGGPAEGVGLATRADGAVLLGVRHSGGQDAIGLQLLALDGEGQVLEMYGAVLPVAAAGAAALAVAGDGAVMGFAARDDGASEVVRLEGEPGRWTRLGRASGRPLAIAGGDDSVIVIGASESRESASVFRLQGGALEPLMQLPGALAALHVAADGVSVVWLDQDSEDGHWQVHRERLRE